ncbi:hypothetical protein ABVT39_008881 [Epinephelus coioides]
MFIVRGITMITWILLVSLFWRSIQDGNGQDNGVIHCGPQNLTVRSSSLMIHVTWKVEPSCSAVQDELIYELVVLIADKQVHYAEVPVKPEQIESTHSWNWTSSLALECASVRLRSRYKNHTSPWKQERNLPEINTSKEPQVFPRDRVLKVGSSFTFCCVLPAGEVFKEMNLSGADTKPTKISNQIFDLTVHLDQASGDSCTNVECETDKTRIGGACVYIGYPPQDSNLQCETRNLISVECHWTVGRTSSSKIRSETKYQLLGSPCKDPSKGTCSKTERIDVGERNWTLTVENPLGKVNLSDTADLTKRVHMFAPQGVTASAVNARNVSLKWEWNVQQYYNLNITCQVNISHVEKNTISQIFGVGLNFAVLNDLIPNWSYNVRVRCGTAQHFWKWSGWSKSVNFHTRGDVPDALDVWMQMKDNQIIAIWKMLLANQSHGQILDYEVTWAKATERERQNRTTVAHNNHSVALSVDTNTDYIITVTARNINGSSTPSTITIPSLNSDRTRVNTSRIIGSNGSFNLSWSASPVASCGYIVDWSPTLGHCIVEWLKVSPSESNAIVFSKNFKDGVRYSLSIYACTLGAPVLLDRREGYVHEERIQDGLFKKLEGKQQDSDFVVSWEPVSLREQTAFIQGYVLYYTDNNKVISFSTDDPAAISLTARGLKNGTYKFTVKAKTAVGECGDTAITSTLNSQSDGLISAVIISLVTVFGLLTLLTIVCSRHWACIKQKVYPPIPKPVLTSPGKFTCPLYVDQYHYSEADIVDVAELHCSEGATVNGYISQENMPFVYAQTPKGYYNQPLKKSIPPPLPLPTTAIPSQSVLPSAPFRRLFPNLSYNLTMQPGDQQSYSGPELQEGSSLEISSGGYQPQGHTEIFTMNQTEEDPGSPISCASTYILLPQSPSR